MPFIRKRRIGWHPIRDAASYVLYVSKDKDLAGPDELSWQDTSGLISKPVIGKTELILPDEWPEFPVNPGIYHIAITSKDDRGNQSAPFLLLGLFTKFLAPSPPSGGGIESLPSVHSGPGTLAHSGMTPGKGIILESLEEVRNSRGIQEVYFRSEEAQGTGNELKGQET